MRRIEFSRRTRELVAQRAGYRCSYPDCDKLTIGPGDDPKRSVIVGQAAHIYGAAVSGRGPRGDKNLSHNELKSPENAIWLCPQHAVLIDKHEGRDYPASKLHSFKSLHESRIAHELRGVAIPFGWVDAITILTSPLFDNDIHIDLDKLNLIVGGNAVGKTALCEWIAGHADASHLDRWRTSYPPNDQRLHSEMRYHNPHPHLVTFDFRGSVYPRYTLDDHKTISGSAPVQILYFSDLDDELRSQPDDLEAIVAAVRLPSLDVKALCDSLGEGGDLFRDARFDETEEPVCLDLAIQTAPGKFSDRTLRGLSGSEMFQFLAHLGTKAANRVTAIAPTLLILDCGFGRLDKFWVQHYAEFLASPNNRFQTIVTTHRYETNFQDVVWSGWQLISLEGTPPSVTVNTGLAGPRR